MRGSIPKMCNTATIEIHKIVVGILPKTEESMPVFLSCKQAKIVAIKTIKYIAMLMKFISKIAVLLSI